MPSRCGVYVEVAKYANGIYYSAISQYNTYQGEDSIPAVQYMLNKGVEAGILEVLHEYLDPNDIEGSESFSRGWSASFAVRFLHFLRGMDAVQDFSIKKALTYYGSNEEAYNMLCELLKLFCESAIKADMLYSLIDDDEAKGLLNVLSNLERRSKQV